MRACPSCKATYSAEQETCAACGIALSEDEAQLSMSDTVETALAANGGGGGAAPRVKSNPTPSGRISDHGAGAGSSAPRHDAIVGASLAGRYQVTRKIGEGGMGAVYEARHVKIGKRVAIKVLLPKYQEKADVVARLLQEARLASSIGHEHIIDITDFGETDDARTFVVMEFLDGESLAQLLTRDGPLPPQRAVAIVKQVAGALGAAHGKGIVHRDVKPENIFITRRGDRDFVKVVDFGISKAMRLADPDAPMEGNPSASPRLTQTGMVLGTPLYMSPEQARGEDELDHRIDVYALGVILYETLTGEVPFRGTNYLSIISQVLSQEPRRPSEVRPDLGISPALEAVVLKAMAKDRAARYQDMAALASDLARIESGDERVTAESHPSPRGRRRAVPAAIGWIAGIAVIAAAAGFLVLKMMKSAAPKAEADEKPAQIIVQSPTIPMPTVPPEREIEMIEIGVTSEPTGARITLEGLDKGTTPTKLSFPETDEIVSLMFEMDKFEPKTVRFFPIQQKEGVHVKLEKKVDRPPPRRPPKNNGTPSPPNGDTKPKPTVDPTGGDIPPLQPK
jgi:serine/threonine-protein kinase